MRRISARALVGRTPEATRRLLDTYLQANGRADGSVAFTLRVRLLPGFADDLSLAHDVLVRFRQSRQDKDDLAIEWTPSGYGPYPSFHGMVNVRPADDPRTSNLEIAGDYEAPGGILGRTFDFVLGRRIARDSLGDLVRRLASELTPVTSSETRR